MLKWFNLRISLKSKYFVILHLYPWCVKKSCQKMCTHFPVSCQEKDNQRCFSYYTWKLGGKKWSQKFTRSKDILAFFLLLHLFVQFVLPSKRKVIKQKFKTFTIYSAQNFLSMKPLKVWSPNESKLRKRNKYH